MERISQDLLGVVTESLRGGSPTQHPMFNRTIECTWAMLELYMYARCKSHNDATLCYMEDTLRHFLSFKHGCLLRRAGKYAKAKANALRTELLKK